MALPDPPPLGAKALPDGTYDGQVVAITGGGTGLGKGMAIRTEPHPRFYTDRTDTVPIAVPALIRNWWPMMFFTVFKAPAEGRTHVFRRNEPFAQIIVIPVPPQPQPTPEPSKP